jgi:asparagine synthase (glutamine-hydrolysing)
MCGIAGYINTSSKSSADTIRLITDAMCHRGPDDSGVFTAELGENQLFMGHRRLAIIDLSQNGHQPMFSTSGRLVIVLNGEIYNHLSIRQQLKFSSWKSHSDTETLLEAIEEWGLKKTLTSTVGMFAFAVLDKNTGELMIARDRLGEKPFYYGVHEGAFYFASELSSFRKAGIALSINPDAVQQYFRFGYVPAPLSMYTGFYKLPTGSFLRFNASQTPLQIAEPEPYWDYRHIRASAMSAGYTGSFDDALNELDRLLDESISIQQLSDVPLGCFLSGGIDSSIVTAYLQRNSTQPIKTFTIGFKEDKYNEAHYARKVADHLHTDHTELYLSSEDCLNLAPTISEVYDEPFGDSSSIPTFLVSKLARTKVTVSLSGDGGDELFGGYSRYQRDAYLWEKTNRYPFIAKQLVSSTARTLAAVPLFSRSGLAGRFRNVGSLFAWKEFAAYYADRRTIWPSKENILQRTSSTLPEVYTDPLLNSVLPYEERMMAIDTQVYLPDDLLVKVDRAAMAVSLETRAPFLDHRIVEFAARLPSRYKIAGQSNKHLLKELLKKHIPSDLIDRPKMGFAMPMDEWLRTSLKEWMLDILNETAINKSGFLNAQTVKKTIDLHLSGKQNLGFRLWPLISFQLWYNNNKTQYNETSFS